MSWAEGSFSFECKVPESEIQAEIMEALDCERGRAEPVHMPLRLLHDQKICMNEEAAEAMLSELYSKYGRKYNYGVRYYAYDVRPSKKIESLKNRVAVIEQKAKEYQKEHSVLTFKAAYIGCPNCGSKLNRSYLKSDRCALCHTDMRSATTLNTLKGYADKKKELERQIREEEKKHKRGLLGNGTVMWLVQAAAYLG